ncbi:SlyX protein [Aestuariivirga litoralis]|uniref:SlyX protein n=1 Tax=Aestuariivirga litoralis TaxID=2650924 RepID=A0A2W2BTG9_9HYPH|nr:SlyX family protein [Aestuariivirga litoralis]PZF78957.1 SlyX protein [Aestuariivirga litoralis]
MPGDGTALLIAELELRIAEQDKVIADLNDMVVAQWRKIDSLERRVSELREEFDEAGRMQGGGPEKPPPHY